MTVLSGMKSQELLETIQSGDAVRLTKIPGVGRKTGERIILELREKLGGIEGRRSAIDASGAAVGAKWSPPRQFGVFARCGGQGGGQGRMAGAPPEFDALFRKALDLVRS
ncbi:MAG: helix-hairpin-helix domain-containing protein [Bryobacterales bacterium]